MRMIRPFLVFVFCGYIMVWCFLKMLDSAEKAKFEYNAKQERLMKQCLADGKKEYECESILRGEVSDPELDLVITPNGPLFF